MNKKKRYNYCIICSTMDCHGKIRICIKRVCRTNRKEYFEGILKWYKDFWLDERFDDSFHYVSYYDIDNDKLCNPPIWYDYECMQGDRVLQICDFDKLKEELLKK